MFARVVEREYKGVVSILRRFELGPFRIREARNLLGTPLGLTFLDSRQFPDGPGRRWTYVGTFSVVMHFSYTYRGDLHNCLFYFPPGRVLLNLTLRNERTNRPTRVLSEDGINPLGKFSLRIFAATTKI